jgi:hypothetical protein
MNVRDHGVLGKSHRFSAVNLRFASGNDSRWRANGPPSATSFPRIFVFLLHRVVHVVASLNRPGPIFIENDDRPSLVYLCSLNGDTAIPCTTDPALSRPVPLFSLSDRLTQVYRYPPRHKKANNRPLLSESDLHHSAITFGGPILLSVICYGYCHLHLN